MKPILFSTALYDFSSAPIFAGLAALAAYAYFHSQKAALKLSSEDYWGLLLCLALGVCVGSVGVYFLLYGHGPARNWEYARRTGLPAGGSFFGVFWGAAAAAYVFARRRRRSFARIADVLGAAAPLGLIFMRVGCLLNGCCYGRPTSLPWGIVYTEPACAVPLIWRGVPLHPTQLYEAAGALAIFLAVHFGLRPRVESGRLPRGSAFLGSAGLYAALRAGVDVFRGGDAGVVSPLGLSVAQAIALLSLAAVAGLWTRRAA